MTEFESESLSESPPAGKPLDARQRRVLGVLIEKSMTTPGGYPMTINAVTVGCNQKSNREPQMNLDAFAVEKTLDELRTLGAVSEVDAMGRAAKYRHHASDWLGVNRSELAVMAELLLRGDQTLGALRARASRMEPIADLADLRPVVEGLMQRGLMIALTPPGRGQLVSHNLYPEAELEALRAGGGVRPAVHAGGEAPSTMPAGPSADEVAELSEAVSSLRSEIADLRERVEALARRLDERL
jgi:uncharacterized protein YceH (UPF0502 family)